MWVNRKLLGEMLGRWHTQAQETVESVKADFTVSRQDATLREAGLHDALEHARDERESLIEAFQMQEHTLNRLLDERNREIALLQSENAILTKQLTVAQNNFEWARVRLNTVEQERAVLIDRVLAIRFPVPEMTREVGPAQTRVVEPKAEDEATSGLLRGLGLPLNIFEDVGDEEAKSAGLMHEDDGTVVTK